MKNVSKLLFLFVLLVVSNYASAQSSEKLKTEQDRLAKKISNTKSLLDKVKTNTEASLNELKIIDKQIQFREDLVRNFDNQIRGAE